MSEWISLILEWLNTHPHLAGLVIFLISAAESVAIIGTIVPGSVMMTAIGALAGSDVIPLWSAIIWAIVGAIVGDGISYWIGYHYKNRLHQIWPFRNNPGFLLKGEQFFHHYGGMSVFIGRFIGPVRALVPLIAGMLGVKPLRFTIANIASAILWAPAYMFPGILLGVVSLEFPSDVGVKAILILLLLTLFIILCCWIFIKLCILMSKQLDNWLTRQWGWLENSRFHYMTTALQHYNPARNHGQLSLAFYIIVVAILFCILTLWVHTIGSPAISINHILYYLFRSIRTVTGDYMMLALTLFGDKRVIASLILVSCCWFAWIKHWRTAWHLFLLGVITFLSINLLKHAVHSPRPWGVLQNANGFSFPSGHATLATTFYIVFGLLLIRFQRPFLRQICYILLGGFIFAISLSRLYLGAHWFTDIVGGWLLGGLLVMAVVLSYFRKEEKPAPVFPYFAVLLLTLIVSYAFVFHATFNQLHYRYTKLSWPTTLTTVANWWTQVGVGLPRYQMDRVGLRRHLFTIQWMGSLSDIKSVLLANEWKEPPKRDWISALHRISNVKSTQFLPLISPVHLDSPPSLVLIKQKPNSKNLLVLRLWRSNSILQDAPHAILWVGWVDMIPSTYSWLFDNNRKNSVIVTPALLFSTLPVNYEIKPFSVLRTIHHKHQLRTLLLIKSPSSQGLSTDSHLKS